MAACFYPKGLWLDSQPLSLLLRYLPISNFIPAHLGFVLTAAKTTVPAGWWLVTQQPAGQGAVKNSGAAAYRLPGPILCNSGATEHY